MHNLRRFLSILAFSALVLLLFSFEGKIYAAPASLLNYQGRLENAQGDLLTGNYYIAFCIYNSTTATACTPGSTPTAGAMSSSGTASGTLNGALWGEVQYFSSTNTPSNEISNGVFNAQLGEYSPITGSLFEGSSNYYIGFNVYNGTGWDGQMTPLQPIDQVAYAMDSALLQGFSPSQTPGANQVVVTNGSGDITLGATNPQINATGTNSLTLNGGGGTGNIQFFNSSNYINSSGDLNLLGGGTFGGNITLTGVNPQVDATGSNNLILNNGSTGDVCFNTCSNYVTSSGNITLVGTGVNNINGNTILTEADLNISGLYQVTGLAETGSSQTGGTLAAGTYYYQVVAQNSAGVSFPSQEISVSLPPVSSPSGLTATVGTSGSVGSDLVASTTYYYEVTATTSNGETTPSAQVSAVEGTTAYPITLAWSAVTGATGYKIYKGTVSGSDYFLASVTSASYTDSGSVATTSATPPSSNTATTNTNTISLSWNTDVGATSYIIYRSQNSNFSPSYSQTTTSVTFTDTGGGSVVTAPETAASIAQTGGGNLNLSNNETLGGGVLSLNNSSGNLINSNSSLGIDVGISAANIGNLQSTTALPSGGTGSVKIVYNGYMYNIAGNHGNCGSYCTEENVYYAPIQSNGSVGTWQNTTPYPVYVEYLSAVEYGGYIYAYGGLINGITSSNAVYSVKINPDGTLGQWVQQNPLPGSLSSAVYFEYNGYVYDISGSINGNDHNSQGYYAQIILGGVLGNWEGLTANTPVDAHEGFEYRGYAYVSNGTNVYYGQILSNGDIQSWTATTSFPANSSSFWLGEYQGYAYSLSQNNNPSYYSQIQPNGGLGSWNELSITLPYIGGEFGYQNALFSNGYIYVVGIGGINNLSYAPVGISNISIGNSLSLSQSGDIISSGNGTFSGGSLNLSNSSVNNINSGSSLNISTYNTNPSLQSWQITSALPVAVSGGGSVEYGGYVYEIGGNNGTSYTGDVYYAQMESNGALGTWNSTASLPNSIENVGSVEYGGNIYVMGGNALVICQLCKEGFVL